MPVVAVAAASETEVLGINSAGQLADLERRYQQRAAALLMAQGVRLADPARFDLRGELQCESDVEIDVGCVFEGRVELGEGVRIGAFCIAAQRARLPPARGSFRIRTSTARRSAPASAPAPGSARSRACAAAPSSRPTCTSATSSRSRTPRLGRGAKANHLAYLGDASVGERANVGAGSITANYDGANKHRTTIGDDVHIGSNSVLVAPVTVGAGATIGAGSVITRDAPAGQLTVARTRPASIAGWKRPTKKPR